MSVEVEYVVMIGERELHRREHRPVPLGSVGTACGRTVRGVSVMISSRGLIGELLPFLTGCRACGIDDEPDNERMTRAEVT